MASWRFAVLFPGSRNALRPTRVVENLADIGLDFDDTVRLCVPIDEAGHLLDVGDELSLLSPILDDLARRLRQGNSFSVEARNSDLVVSCQFRLGTQNPYISLGWSRRLFGTISAGSQETFWLTIRRIARESGACYVIIIDDPPDHFEDRFVEIGPGRMLDVHVDHAYGLGLREIWIDVLSVQTPPEGPEYGSSEDIGDHFRKFKLGGGLG